MEDLTKAKRKKAPITRGEVSMGSIGEKTGVSRERVRQIEQRALGKLRRALRIRGFTAKDFFD